MKFVKWKILIITSLACLLPIVLGLLLWEKIPQSVAIHFNLYNEPDNFTSKGFMVFGIPVLMMVLQAVCCIANDINAKKHKGHEKFENVVKWIIPAVTVSLYVVTLGYSIGWNIDIRKSAAVIVGIVFLVTGKYLTKLDYIKNYKLDPEKAKKINEFTGVGMSIIGILMLLTVFLPPISTVLCLSLLIPYIILIVIYGVKTGRKK